MNISISMTNTLKILFYNPLYSVGILLLSAHTRIPPQKELNLNRTELRKYEGKEKNRKNKKN